MTDQFELRPSQAEMERLLKEGDLSGAIAVGQDILRNYPRHLATYRNLAWTVLLADQTWQATDLLRRVISADPEDGEAWAHLAQLLYNPRQPNATAPYWIIAFDLRPWGVSWPRPVDVRSRIRNIQWEISERGRIILPPAALAHFLVRGRHWGRAVAVLRPLVEEAPERLDLKLALAATFWHLGKSREARDLALEVQRELPYSLKANMILAEAGESAAEQARQRVEALDPLGEYRRLWFE